MRFRLLRRRLTVSAPRMAVRSALQYGDPLLIDLTISSYVVLDGQPAGGTR